MGNGCSKAYIAGCAALLLVTAVAAMAQRGAPKVVKTSIEVAYNGAIAASDEIIVFGTGFTTGVGFIRPGDDEAGEIPGAGKFSSKTFGICGSKIILANTQDFTIAVFDTAKGTLAEIPESELKLRAITGGMHAGGGIQTSGNFAAVITDTGGNDNSAIKVIDVSAESPRLIRFEGSGPDNNSRMVFGQVAIDAGSGLVAAAGGNDYDIKLFDFNAPETEPRSFDLEEFRGVGQTQMRFEGGKILFHTGEAFARAFLLDTETGKVSQMSKAIYGLALGGGRFVYFASRDASDTHGIVARAAVGNAGAQPRFSAGAAAIGGSRNNGTVGFGASAAVTPDGKGVFIAGMEDVGRTERFQSLSGTRFTALADRTNRPAFLQGSDVVASSKIVAFKTGVDNRTTLAYFLLR